MFDDAEIKIFRRLRHAACFFFGETPDRPESAQPHLHAGL